MYEYLIHSIRLNGYDKDWRTYNSNQTIIYENKILNDYITSILNKNEGWQVFNISTTISDTACLDRFAIRAHITFVRQKL